eukprot:m.99278 g.99278  ORF g.99278 m.99278 type:complete len:511 (+) comp13673_c0_seq1:362-1894(+)
MLFQYSCRECNNEVLKMENRAQILSVEDGQLAQQFQDPLCSNSDEGGGRNISRVLALLQEAARKYDIDNKDSQSVNEASQCLSSVFAILSSLSREGDGSYSNEILELCDLVVANCGHFSRTNKVICKEIAQAAKQLIGWVTTQYQKIYQEGDQKLALSKGISCHISQILSHLNFKKDDVPKPTQRSIVWMVHRIFFPDMQHDGVVSALLAPLLNILESYKTFSKCCALSSLTHIVATAVPNELRAHGIDRLIMDAVRNLLYSHDANVIHETLRLVEILLPVSEPNPETSDGVLHDQVLERVLQAMSYESKLPLRSSLSRHLAPLVRPLGLRVVKHFRMLFTVIESYITERNDFESMLFMLRALEEVIVSGWPRIRPREASIVEMLTKAVDIVQKPASLEESSTESCRRALCNKIVHQALYCTQLLKTLNTELKIPKNLQSTEVTVDSLKSYQPNAAVFLSMGIQNFDFDPDEDIKEPESFGFRDPVIDNPEATELALEKLEMEFNLEQGC